jgi:hypothetical protein
MKTLLSLDSLLIPKSRGWSANGKFYNKPLRRVDKKGLKFIKASVEEGL